MSVHAIARQALAVLARSLELPVRYARALVEPLFLPAGNARWRSAVSSR